MVNLAKARSYQGRTEEAVGLAEQAIAIARRMGLVMVEATATADLGRVLRRGGRLAEAETALREAIDRCASVGEQPGLDRAQEDLALLQQGLAGSR